MTTESWNTPTGVCNTSEPPAAGNCMSRQLHNRFPPGSIESRDLQHMLHPNTNLQLHHRTGPMVQERASGVYLWDNHGKQYLEGLAGLWCTALGYGEEELVRTAEEQLRKMSYGSTFLGRTHEPSVLLAEKLKAMAPFEAGRVFFGLSGSDANDSQVKLLWYYHNVIGQPRKKKIISRWHGYHGTTLGAGSLTGLAPFHRHFDLPLPGFLHTESPYHYRNARDGESQADYSTRLAGELEALIQREGPETVAAFIAEPVQGAGGVIVPPEGYFEKIQAVLDRYGIMLIDDEVICGFGRTGQAFGAQTFGMRPTTMTVAKALSSAYLPISAAVIPEFMYEPMIEASGEVGTFGHGYTYSGHPVCAAVALRTLELMEERRLFAHAALVGELFQDRLRALADHPLVGDTRGVGLLGGVELVADKRTGKPFESSLGVGATCSTHAHEAGLIVRNLGDVIALCPPLIISADQVDELFAKLGKALDETLQRVAGHLSG